MSLSEIGQFTEENTSKTVQPLGTTIPITRWERVSPLSSCTPGDRAPLRGWPGTSTISDKHGHLLEQLLDEAERAAANNDWATVKARSENVLGFDTENERTNEYLAQAEVQLLKPERPESQAADSLRRRMERDRGEASSAKHGAENPEHNRLIEETIEDAEWLRKKEPARSSRGLAYERVLALSPPLLLLGHSFVFDRQERTVSRSLRIIFLSLGTVTKALAQTALAFAVQPYSGPAAYPPKFHLFIYGDDFSWQLRAGDISNSREWLREFITALRQIGVSLDEPQLMEAIYVERSRGGGYGGDGGNGGGNGGGGNGFF